MSAHPATHPRAAAPLVARTVAIDDPGDLIALLPSADPTAALAWIRGGEGIVGIGEAARITTAGADRFETADTAFTALAASAVVRDDVSRPGTGLVAFGSFAFSADSPCGGVLIVPKIVVGRSDGRGWLTAITPGSLGPVPTVDSIREAAADLLPAATASFADGSCTHAEWIATVSAAVDQIQAGEVDKVVLARDLIATLSGPGDARRVLRRLETDYSSCWTFAVDGLFGATPELLARRHRGLISSRVLAGTIQRSGSGDDDAARAAALARDSKELSEHAYAVDSLVDSLEPFADSIAVPDAPFILHLPNVMHLATDVTAVPAPAAKDYSSLVIAEKFHPTAAVCGTPTPVAARLLAEHEGFDRDRYAAPVGWLGADGDGEWGIALRTARAHSAQSWQLFAGCGIMAESDPESEWAETEAKFAPMKQALAGD